MFGKKKPLLDPYNSNKGFVNWGFSCGRHYLRVGKYIVAMEGDICRCPTFLGERCWTESMIKEAAESIAMEHAK